LAPWSKPRRSGATAAPAAEADREGDTLLEVNGLRAGYGGRPVVYGVDLTVAPGEIVAVLGHNGAGKTTTLNAIFGFIEPMSGTVSLAGSEVTKLPPVEHARRGITFVPAERFVFQDLSVEDNLSLAAMQEPSAERREEHRRRADALFPVLSERPRQYAGTMSGGEQRMLSIGMALMAGPQLMLLDEPSLGLSPLLVETIMDAVRTVADELRVGVVMLEQNVTQALRVADRVYVMRSGEIIAHETAAELRTREHLWDLF
jgi:branched-chain amino acid transport system ATP-binding protein